MCRRCPVPESLKRCQIVELKAAKATSAQRRERLVAELRLTVETLTESSVREFVFLVRQKGRRI